MGNCCSNVADGQASVGGIGSSKNYVDDDANNTVDAFLKSRSYYRPCSQIELSLSASNLRDREVPSKSDRIAVLYSERTDGTIQELGRTELVQNSVNPRWITKFKIAYQFEMVQNLMFHVYDVDTHFHTQDTKMLILDEQDFLGEAKCNLSEIVTKSNRCMTLDLSQKEQSSVSIHSTELGKLTVCAEESTISKTTIECIFRCTDLEAKDVFSKTDPFLLISRTAENGSAIPIFKTDVLKNDHSPTWKPVYLTIQQVGSKDNPLTVECFNFNTNGKHDLLGKVQKSLEDLEKLHASGSGVNFFVPTGIGPTHQTKVLKSQMFVEKFTEKTQHTFLGYLASGYELNFMVAVDFTASNGNPRLPDSLHYIDSSGRQNAYQRAITEVGGVLQFYDKEKHFPAWGFGARPIDGPVSHCFNLNGSNSYCKVEGIQGIMMAYRSALFNVSLAGPTLFGPVINAAAQIAGQSVARKECKYFVLQIITDGVITDLEETKDAIIEASDLPLSILIVGVGGADFKEMEVLDANKGDRLGNSQGKVASRDIVQFVKFQEVQSGEVFVAQSLLADLPLQFLEYWRAHPTP